MNFGRELLRVSVTCLLFLAAPSAFAVLCNEILAGPAFTHDLINGEYFSFLVTKNKEGAQTEPIAIFDSSVDQRGTKVVYPTAIAPENLKKQISVQSYQQLKVSQDASGLKQSARSVDLFIAKMQAGTGSSILRTGYLARINKIEPSTVRLGAKGTDLKVPQLSRERPVSIAEAQIRQVLVPGARTAYHSVHWIDLVSPETAPAIEDIWNHASMAGVVREKPVIQYNVPTVNTEGTLSTNRMAPAGHGLFAYNALEQAIHQTEAETSNKIVVIANGEDLSGSPDPAIVGYMKKNQIPILMITTDKTEIDLKGGQIAVATETDGAPYLTMVEIAQAEASGQKKLFEEIGLRPGDQKALFNTNMVLINFEILGPLLKAEAKRVGEDHLFEMIGPSLIKNWKSQIDSDGVERKYLQLEGAMGSMILNLDRYFRATHGKSLVGLVNIESEFRTQFFAPIKTAFDYYMQFYSDRFSYDVESHRLIDHRPGALPSVRLQDPATKDKFYADVDNVITTFRGTKILEMDELHVSGRFLFNHIAFKGKVHITNKAAKTVDLADYLASHPGTAKNVSGDWLLENLELVIE